MIKFFIEPGYEVKSPERAWGNAGIDFYVPNHSDAFVKAFNEKNMMFAPLTSLTVNETGEKVIRIEPTGRVNIPSGVRGRIDSGVMLVAQNKSGVATKLGLVCGATLVDPNYKGMIHLSLINTSNKTVDIPLGMKITQFVPASYETSKVETVDGNSGTSVEEFYKDFEFDNRGEGAFGSTGV